MSAFAVPLALIFVSGALAAGAAPDLTLTPQRAVSRNIEAYPRIAAPATPETAKVNDALAKGDARVKNAARDCSQDGYGPGQWNRTVSAPFRSGDLLTVAASDEWSCPTFSGTFFVTLTFDLKTGEAVDWGTLFPTRIAGDPVIVPAADTTPLHLVASPILNEVYRRKILTAMDAEARAQCAEGFQHDYRLMLWLDAERETVVMRAVGFPKALVACTLDAVLNQEELALLKAEPRLTDALKAAHAAHGWSQDLRPAGSRPRPPR